MNSQELVKFYNNRMSELRAKANRSAWIFDLSTRKRSPTYIVFNTIFQIHNNIERLSIQCEILEKMAFHEFTRFKLTNNAMSSTANCESASRHMRKYVSFFIWFVLILFQEQHNNNVFVGFVPKISCTKQMPSVCVLKMIVQLFMIII